MTKQQLAALQQLRIATMRKLYEARRTVHPKTAEEVSIEELSKTLGTVLQDCTDKERERLWLRSAVALKELETLTAELSEQRDTVAGELRKLRGHRSAAGAYARSQAPQRSGNR